MKEKEIISMQERIWNNNRNLLIVLVGKRWKAYNESAKVISSITGYRLRRKVNASSTVDLVSFPGKALKNVKNKLSENRVSYTENYADDDAPYISYSWKKDIPEVIKFHLAKVKNKRREFRLDANTLSLLKQIMGNGGFGGKKTATASEVLRYAIHHFYDNKPVNLKEADNLIWAISMNRKPLDSALFTLKSIVDQIRAIGVNINQIAHRINYLEKKAEDEGYETGRRIDDLVLFREDVMGNMYFLEKALDEISPKLMPAVQSVCKTMESENEFMNRVLI